VAERLLLQLDQMLIKLIPAWENLPNEIKLKTYLQLYCLEKLFVENAANPEDQTLSSKEMDILRVACLY